MIKRFLFITILINVILFFNTELKSQIIIEINSLSPELISQIEKESKIIKIITPHNWEKIKSLSDRIVNSKGDILSISDSFYLSINKQVEIINSLAFARFNSIQKEILLDLLISYFFLTYYYRYQGDFFDLYKYFLAKLKVDYKFSEQANRNYYTHNYLKNVLSSKENDTLVKYYKKIYNQTKFDEFPKGD